LTGISYVLYIRQKNALHGGLMDNTEFCREVESLILHDRYDNYIDAVLYLCEEHGIEPFMAARLLSKPIKEKIKREGQEVNLLPRKTRLPMK
jgi:hypothetical protein